MLKKTAKIIITTVLLAGISIPAFTQERNEEVTIIAPYQPTILDPAKSNFMPVFPDIDRREKDFQYNILDRKVSTQIEVTPVDPRRPSRDLQSRQFRNLVKAGFGNYLTPYLFFTANTVPDDEKTLGVKGEAISSFQGIEGYGPGGYAKINLEGYGKRHFRKSTLSASIRGDYRQFHYYGFQPDSFPSMDVDKKDIRQSLPSMGAKIGLASIYSERRDFKYDVSLNINYIGDSYQANEFLAETEITLAYLDDVFNLGDREELGIELGGDYQSFNDSLGGMDFYRVRAFPYYEFVYDQFRLKAGINAFFAGDTASSFHLYPYLRGEVSLIDNNLSIYAGIRGGLERNSFYRHSFINPYITNVPELKNTNEKFELFAGTRASAGLFELYAEISSLNFEDMPFYVTDTATALDNQFSIIYDDGQVFTINAGAGVNILKELLVKLRAGLAFYSLDREEKAWHKPSFETGLEIVFSPLEKLNISGEVNYVAERFAKGYEEGNTDISLDPYLDLNLGADYNITGNFSVFLSAMNILNKKYHRWHNYPVQGFQVMGGVIFTTKN